MKAFEIDGFAEILEDAERFAESEAEMDFVAYLRDKFRKYDDNTFVSDKQLAWLKKIADWE